MRSIRSAASGATKQRRRAMKAQIVKYTVTPGQAPVIVKVGLPSTDRAKLQADVDSRNRAYADQDYDPSKPLVSYGVIIVH
jgi:hypothetical protein